MREKSRFPMIRSAPLSEKTCKNAGISAGSCCPSASRVMTAITLFERSAEPRPQRRALALVGLLRQHIRAGLPANKRCFVR